jgi:hypothetical protein
MRADEGQRLSGLLLAASWHRRLLEAHDEDWFRNPRAIEEIRAEAEEVPEASVSPERLAKGARELSGWLAERLE